MKKYCKIVCIAAFLLGGALYGQKTPDVFTCKVGEYIISLLSEGQRMGKTDILIGATPEMLRQCVPDGTFPNATNAFLVRTPEKTILVDAGYGTKLFENMKSLGVTPEQIDVVLFTHMHGDHIGGMLKDGKVTFPHAEVYLAKPEHDYWMSDQAKNQNARQVIELYKDKLHLFVPDDIQAKPAQLLPGIQGIAAYGHTPGHTAYLIESKGEKMLIWGDLTHAMAIQMPYPQVAVTYDVDAGQATDSRKILLEYVAKNNIPVAGMHIVFPGIGKVSGKAGTGYSFIPFEGSK